MGIIKAALLLALVLPTLAAGQGTRIFRYSGLYRAAGDFRRQRPTPAGSGADGVLPARAAYGKAGPGQPGRRVLPDSLWGYVGLDGVIYRVYRRRAYQVEQADTLAIYSVLVNGSKHSFRKYFFSSGLGGPVAYLTRRRLRRAYAANPRFLARLDSLKWYQPLAARVALPGGTRPYRVVALYRQALGLPAPQRR